MYRSSRVINLLAFMLICFFITNCTPPTEVRPSKTFKGDQFVDAVTSVDQNLNTSVYFVDAVNGRDENSGTSVLSPLKSISKINSLRFLPGDSICFKRGGVWTGQLNISHSGTTNHPIVFTAYGTGTKPIIKNPGVEYGSAINITADWVVVENFLVREAHESGIIIRRDADHNIVRNIEATKVGMGFAIIGQFNLVTANYAHDLTMIKNTPGGDDDYGAVGVWLFASNNEVSYNTLINCIAPSLDYGLDGGMVEFYGDVDNSYVHHNWGQKCNGAFEVGGNGETMTGNIVAYNISVDNVVSGGFHVGGKFGVRLENFRIENNVFVDMGSRDYTIGIWGADAANADVRYRNNIFYLPNHKRVGNQAGFTHEHNLYYLGTNTALGFPVGKGDRIGNPLFTNIDILDFHLKSGSPAIDAGIILTHTVDYGGKRVHVGKSADIGIFEFGSY